MQHCCYSRWEKEETDGWRWDKLRIVGDKASVNRDSVALCVGKQMILTQWIPIYLNFTVANMLVVIKCCRKLICSLTKLTSEGCQRRCFTPAGNPGQESQSCLEPRWHLLLIECVAAGNEVPVTLSHVNCIPFKAYCLPPDLTYFTYESQRAEQCVRNPDRCGTHAHRFSSSLTRPSFLLS